MYFSLCGDFEKDFHITEQKIEEKEIEALQFAKNDKVLSYTQYYKIIDTKNLHSHCVQEKTFQRSVLKSSERADFKTDLPF